MSDREEVRPQKLVDVTNDSIYKQKSGGSTGCKCAKPKIIQEMESLRQEKNQQIHKLLENIELCDGEIYNLNAIIDNLNHKLSHKDTLITKQLHEYKDITSEINRYERDNLNLQEKIKIYSEKFSFMEKTILKEVEEITKQRCLIDNYKKTHECDIELINHLTGNLKLKTKEAECFKKEVLDLATNLEVLTAFKLTATETHKKLLRQIEELNKEILLKGTQYNELELKFEHLCSDKSGLEITLKEKDKLLQEIIEKYEISGSEAENLKIYRMENSNELISLRSAYESVKIELAQLKQTNSVLNHNILEMEMKLDESQKIHEKSYTELSEIKKKFSIQEKEVLIKHKEFAEMVKRLNDEISKNVVMESEINHLQIGYEDAKKKNLELAAAISLKDASIINLTGKVKDQESDASKFKVSNKNLIENLKQSQCELNNKMRESNVFIQESENVRKRLQDLQLSNEKLIAQITQLSELNSKKDDEIIGLHSKIHLLENQISQWRMESQSIVSENSISNSKLSSIQIELAHTAKSLNEKNELCIKLEEENKKLQKLLKENQKDFDLVKEENEEFDEEIRMLGQKFAFLEREISEKNNEIFKLRAALDNSLAQAYYAQSQMIGKESDLRQSTTMHQSEIETLKALLIEKERNADEWHERYMSILDQLNKCSNENAILKIQIETANFDHEYEIENNRNMIRGLSQDEALNLMRVYQKKMELMKTDLEVLSEKVQESGYLNATN